ncbi:MAG: hypothetical protein HY706_22145 [Candidatus Hydrogenedentes bacterium]|nr:hypothetical protein [Candidatus Hydrogenedentota bacterium]
MTRRTANKETGTTAMRKKGRVPPLYGTVRVYVFEPGTSNPRNGAWVQVIYNSNLEDEGQTNSSGEWTSTAQLVGNRWYDIEAEFQQHDATTTWVPDGETATETLYA